MRLLLKFVCLVGLFFVTVGCSQVEKQVEYGNMTGAIPQDSPLGGLGTGRDARP